uniref:OTU domain-containing protein 5 n=1 Tax=Rhizophora mucronata TaxID=61149 RepID=A0A2P2KSL9_RHIMU
MIGIVHQLGITIQTMTLAMKNLMIQSPLPHALAQEREKSIIIVLNFLMTMNWKVK